MTTKALIIIIASILTLSSDVKVDIIAQGFSTKPASIQNKVIESGDELKKIWSQLGIKNELPTIDFNKELVAVLISKGKLGSSIEISKVERTAQDAVDVRYVVKPISQSVSNQRSEMFPYIVVKLSRLDAGKSRIKFVEDVPLPPVPVNTAIGRAPNYTNVLKQYEDTATVLFFPLDKGNFWTYKIETQGKVDEETYSILSISQDGWSVYDNFFGKKDIAMRIDPDGNILVSSKSGTGDFYTPGVQKDIKKSELSTPAGKFDELMVVTVAQNDKFWFKDIYAKGIGLVYHEHKSPKGAAKYTLIKAHIKGKTYPKAAEK